MGDLCTDVQGHGPAAMIAGEHFGAGVSVLASRQAVSCAMGLLSWVELTAQQSCVVFFFPLYALARGGLRSAADLQRTARALWCCTTTAGHNHVLNS